MPRYPIRLLRIKLRSKEYRPYRFSFSFEEFDPHGDVPSYGILSHTWYPGKDDVLYEHIIEHRGKDKPGYKKLEFCATWALKRGLDYIWADTCCMRQRGNSGEKAWALSNMFQWYKKADACYVYLSDVVFDFRNKDKDLRQFRKARWHTRGWTLQEMLAPKHVEFYDKAGHYVGTKNSLSKELARINGPLFDSIQKNGNDLWEVSRYERLCWADYRKVNKDWPEDQVYCVVSLCGVSLAPNYGEGITSAWERLIKAVDAANEQGGPKELWQMLPEMVESVQYGGKKRYVAVVFAAAAIYPGIRAGIDKRARKEALNRCDEDWVRSCEQSGRLQRVWRKYSPYA